MNSTIDYSDVIALVEAEISKIEKELQVHQSQILLNKIYSYKQAMSWLKIGQNYNVNPKSKFFKFPITMTQTSSSEYRIIEDNESDDRYIWTELKIEGEELRPSTGDILIQRK